MREHNDDKTFKKQKNKMNRLIIAISILTVLTGCNPTPPKTTNVEDTKSQIKKSTSPPDTTPRVTGIGGIFFYSDNPKVTNEWYAKNLGLEINKYGSSGFEFRDVNKPEAVGSLQWKPFKKGSEYFAPSKKDFMINYRVQNIEGLVSKLKGNGVTILDSIASYDYGKFIHIIDAEGNKIELWEPVDKIK